MRSSGRRRGSVQPGEDRRTDKLPQPPGKPAPGTGRLQLARKAARTAPERAALGRGHEMQTRQRQAGPLIDRKHNEVIRVPLQQLFSFHGENVFHS